MKIADRKWLLVVASFLVCANLVMAQELNVSGTVTARESDEGLPGANVKLKGTTLGTSTDANGKFRVQAPGMSQATLVVSFIGYRTVEVSVTGSQDVTVALEEDVLKLSEVVVTGLATSVARQNLANAVATVTSAELVSAPAQTLERALGGKFAGVNVSQNTGAPGGGINVDLRGTSTIEGGTQPLYVIDGVIINNAANQSGIDLVTAATGAGSANPQGQPSNRVADINPNEIETIEVLKGSSAAAIYGSKASNGVIIITTKQGTSGKTRIEVSQQVGFNSLLKKIGARKFTAATAEAQYGANGKALFEKSGGQFIDYEDIMYGENGFLNETSVSARGGSDRTQFYLSGLLRDENGIIKNSGYQKYAGRLNLNHKLSDRIKLDAYFNYVRSESDRGITGNDNTNTSFGFSLGFTPSFLDITSTNRNGLTPNPDNPAYPLHPLNPSNPIHTRDVLTNHELVNRTLGSMRLHWNIWNTAKQNLNFIVQTGVDYYSQENAIVSPPELQYERNSSQPGASLLGETVSTNSNLYFNLAHSYASSGTLNLQTSAGFQFENQNLNNVLNEARGLIVTQTNIDQAASVNAYQDRVIQRERGFYVQEEINLSDKIYLTGGIRGDASSANGEVDKYFFYPKASASIRLAQYGVLSSFANEFKPRIAYGETGNLPNSSAKFTSLIPRNIGGLAGLLPATRRGNSNIQPERTKELELGFDAVMFSEHASLSFTYFRQNISDLLLSPSLPPSSGFEDEVVNGGKMKTQGVEVSLGVTPLKSRNLNWTSRLNFYKTSSEITELTVDPFNLGGFATFLGTFRIEEGLSPTTIIGAERDASGKNKALGNETPDFQLSWNNSLNLGAFELSFLWDWKEGGDVINLGKLITDLGGTTEDYDTGAAAKRLSVLGSQTVSYIEDGSYIKLRELSLNFTVPRSSVMSLFNGQVSHLKLGVSGRNLLMKTDYTGYDPEVSQFGNVSIGRSVDTIPFPSSRSMYFNVSFGL